MSLAPLTAQLVAGQDLARAQVAIAAAALALPETGDEPKAEFLTALARKGETAAEVAAFAEEFRARAIDPGVGEWSSQAVDIVGTGGDHAGGFNISSMVVLVLACAGVPVMKHGNRGITSKCGSADLLGGLGFDIMAPPEKLRSALRELGYVFFFAPNFHPTFKHIGPVRKALAARGQRSVFNILGPMINPGRPTHVLLGVFAEPWVGRLAESLHTLGATGLAAHGVLGEGRGIDELTSATPNVVRGFGRHRDIEGRWHATDFGLEVSPFTDLQGSDLATNLALVDAVLVGRGPRGLVDTIALNASVAMWVTGRTRDRAEGIGLARELLLGGAVENKIKATKEFFQA